MDRILADTYLKQWGAWATEADGKSAYAVSSWQKYVESGYNEESARHEIAPGPDDLMMLVESAVTRVSNHWPAMGTVIKKVYLGHRYAPTDAIESALLRFISAWYEVDTR